jgi:hypothetical protein
MMALEFINIVRPEHDRTSCNDENLNNGFHSKNGSKSWHGRCTRCIALEISQGKEIPSDFDASDFWW